MDRSLLKGEVPRFLADLVHPLLSERPFKFQRHLIQDFGYDKLISNYWYYTYQQYGSGLFFNPILVLSIPLTHSLERSPNGGMNFVK